MFSWLQLLVWKTIVWGCGIGIYVLEIIFGTVVPLFRTSEIIRTNTIAKYDNCLSFWCLYGLIGSFEYLTFNLFNNFTAFHIIKLSILIAAQVNDFSTSQYLISIGKPFAEPYTETILDKMQSLDSEIQNALKLVSNRITSSVRNSVERSGNIIPSSIQFVNSWRSMSQDVHVSTNADDPEKSQ
eukprot:26247_1